MNFIQVIQAVKTTKGTKAKLALLEQHKAVPLLSAFLNACFDPQWNYYIEKFKPEELGLLAPGWGEVFPGHLPEAQDWFITVMNRLHSRQVTGNAARDYLSQVHAVLDENQRQALVWLLDRNPGMGVAEKGINSVWPELIRIVPYMRCTLPKDSNINKIDWTRGVFSQIKADGSFANMYSGTVANTVVETRNGTIYPAVPAFEPLRQDLELFQVFYNGKEMDDPGMVLHGELLVKNAEGQVLPREVGNGLLNSLVKGSGALPDGHTIVADVWDAVCECKFKTRTAETIGYEERFGLLEEFLKDHGHQLRAIQLIESKTVYSREEAKQHYREVRLRGLEGTVLKAVDAVWMDGDNKDQIKFKAEATVELRITGFKAGEGKYLGSLGSLVCETDDELLQVGVSGMTDAWRKEFWENQTKYMGSIVTVLANGVMEAKEGGKAALFLPRLVEVRTDRVDTDTLARCRAIFEAA